MPDPRPDYRIYLKHRGPDFAFRYAAHIWRERPDGPDVLVGVGVDHTEAAALACAVEEVRNRRRAGGAALERI